MSILSSMYHNEMQNLPNEVHNIPDDDTKIYCRTSVLTQEARRRKAAMQRGVVRPTLYYSEEGQIPCLQGVWESPHAVASKLEMKEEYPLG